MYAYATAGDGGVKVWRAQQVTPPGGGKRGAIVGFSKASRRRLIDHLMFVPWADYRHQDKHSARASMLMVTLTYPKDYPDCWETWKVHLDNFRRALAHERPKGFDAIWRLEYQKRGAPHFHILIRFRESVRVAGLKSWALGTWARIVRSGDPQHRWHGVDVRPVYTPKVGSAGLVRYLVKYLGKVDDQTRPGGRCWGEWGQLSEVVRAAATFDSRQGFVEFLRRIRRWGKRSRYLRRIHSVTGLRLFGDGTNVLNELTRGLDGVAVFTT